MNPLQSLPLDRLAVKCERLMRRWGGWIRTNEWRIQSPLPYHLATPQRVDAARSRPLRCERRTDLDSRASRAVTSSVVR